MKGIDLKASGPELFQGGSAGEGVEVGVREKLLQLLKEEITETSKGLEKKRGWIFKMVASSRLGN